MERISRRVLLKGLAGVAVIPIAGCADISSVPVTKTARPTPEDRNIPEKPLSPTPTPTYIRTVIDPTMIARTTFITQPSDTPRSTIFDARPATVIPPSATFTPIPSPAILRTLTSTPNTPTFVPDVSTRVTVSPESTIEIRSGSNIFTFGKDVPEDQRKEIQDAVEKATKWYISHGINQENISVFAFADAQTTVEYYLQRNPQLPESERARMRNDAPKLTAFAGSKDDFYVVTTSPGWTHASPIIGGPALEGRYHTVAHEIFHIWQTKIGAYKYRPVPWLNEGIAHYFAALFLQETNIFSYARIRSGHIDVTSRLKHLSMNSLESYPVFYPESGSADNYSLAFLAVEHLVRNSPDSGFRALVDYWIKISEGQPHPEAFKAAFSKTTTEFYNEFELYRGKGFK